MKPIEKILGADVELGNVIESLSGATPSNLQAARLLLAEIDGVPGSAAIQEPQTAGTWAGTWLGQGGYGSAAKADPPGADPQDWGRKFLATNGGCAYIDLGHLEICMPEVRSARDFVRYHHAGLALARAARAASAARLPEDQRLVLLANNSDRQGNSWGGHLNVLVTRELWQRVFDRMYPALFVLASFQVSSILYTGQGKVGAENSKPWVPFQLSQRGDFFECIEGLQTTHRRPIVNSRDEAHCGLQASAGGLARLHVIFHDTTLTHLSNYLKAGVTQLVLALMETGWCDRSLMLDEPLAALTTWGHDPDLRACAALENGRGISALEHQRLFLDAVQRFVAAGQAGCVPEAPRIVEAWEDTLDRLERRDWAVLARRLDWVLKRELLTRAIDRNPELSWESPSIRAADLRFASLDRSTGLYEAIAAAGGIDVLVSEEDVERACVAPPEDTRAWSRAMVLRHAKRSRIESVDWDHIRMQPSQPGGKTLVLRMDDPRQHGRAEAARERHATRRGAATPAH